jgi:stage III sporulation protein SpoIIIAA
VQLVGTAHGMTVENLIKNPSLQMLVGGIQVCTYVHMNSQISNSKEELT